MEDKNRSEEWIGKINRDERLSFIRESWLEASKAKSVEVAQELGGRVHHFATPLMEAGISSIILLKEKATDNVLFRGVRERGKKVLKHQVCGMLREGIGEDGNLSSTPISTHYFSFINGQV